jgi:outer membrane protein assembly factor BamB
VGAPDGKLAGTRWRVRRGPPTLIALLAAGVLVSLLAVPVAAAGSGTLELTSSPAVSVLEAGPHPTTLEVGANFPMYLDNTQRTSSVSGEQLINASDVSDLTHLWQFNASRFAYPQPIAVDGVVYEGSWSGDEYALSATNGTLLWKTFLGVDTLHNNAGVTSSATWSNGTLYVGGGNSTLYALNASTGRILWESLVGVKGQNYYVWSSPLVTGRFVYIGVDSYLDNPLVGSGLDQFFRSNGTLDHYFNSSVPAAIGSGIWSSPSLLGGTIFVSTGNAQHRAPTDYSESVVSLNESSLAPIDSYQVNRTVSIGDGDFGATPTVYRVPTGHGLLGMVAAQNKNGIFYGLYQSNLSLAWSVRVSNPGPTNRTITSAAWNGKYLFDVSLGTTINGTEYNQSVRAFNGRTGQIVWQVGLSEPMTGQQYAAPLCFNGMVVVADDSTVFFFNATSGDLLFRYNAGAVVPAAVSVSRGELFMGLTTGKVIALDLKLKAGLNASATSVPAWAPDSFRAVVSGGLPPYTLTWRFGDGSSSDVGNPVHAFATPGVYQVSVTVTDLAGSVLVTNLTVVVRSAIDPGATAGYAGEISGELLARPRLG